MDTNGSSGFSSSDSDSSIISTEELGSVIELGVVLQLPKVTEKTNKRQVKVKVAEKYSAVFVHETAC